MSTHPYFIKKAAEALTAHGLTDADPAPLAQWAEEAKAAASAGDQQVRRSGVIVDDDGQIAVDTIRTRGDFTQWLATHSGAAFLDRVSDSIDATLTRLHQETGQHFAHITYTDVAEGAVKPLAAAGLLKPATVRVTRRKIGLSLDELAHRLGVATSTVRKWDSGASTPRDGVLSDLAVLRAEHDADVQTIVSQIVDGHVTLPAPTETKPLSWWDAVGVRVDDLAPYTVFYRE